MQHFLLMIYQKALYFHARVHLQTAIRRYLIYKFFHETWHIVQLDQHLQRKKILLWFCDQQLFYALHGKNVKKKKFLNRRQLK